VRRRRQLALDEEEGDLEEGARGGEMWGDMGRCGEMWGDLTSSKEHEEVRYGEIWEIWGDVGRCGEI